MENFTEACKQAEDHISLWGLLWIETPFTHDELVRHIVLLENGNLRYFLEQYLKQQQLDSGDLPNERSEICRRTAEMLFEYHDDSKGTLQDVLESCAEGVIAGAVQDLKKIQDDDEYFQEAQNIKHLLRLHSNHMKHYLQILRDFSNDLSKRKRGHMKKAMQQSTVRIHDELVIFKLNTIVPLLRDNHGMTKIEISSNLNMLEENFEPIFKALDRKSKLEDMVISTNPFGLVGANALSNLILLNSTIPIRHLRLTHLKIGNDEVFVIVNALHHNTFVTDLDLSNNRISLQGTQSVANMIKHNTYIQTLQLNHNNLDDDCVVALATSLDDNTTLQNLYLEFNNIQDDGAQALAESNHSLSVLSVAFNDIGPRGGIALATSLYYNVSLTNLNLDGNHIGDEGAIAFSKVLEHNKTLKHLNLDRNQISNQGGQALAHVLSRDNRALKDLQFGLNHAMDWDTKHSIFENLDKRQQVKKSLRPLSSLVDPYAQYKNQKDQLLWETGNELLARTMQRLME